MCMASTAVKVEFPDGRTEDWGVITHFQKTGTNDDIIVFETNRVDNRYKVAGVSRLKDGLYGNIIDAEEWKRAKEGLVASLHGQLSDNDYKITEEVVKVTADPYHPLALKDENLDQIMVNYEQFLARQKPAEVAPSPQVVPPVPENPINAQTPSAPEASVDNPTPAQENEANQSLDIPIIGPVTETAAINQNENNNAINDSIPQPMAQNSGVTETQNIQPIANNDVAPAIPEANMPTSPVENQTVASSDMLDPFAIADSLDNQANEVHQDIVPPQGINLSEPIVGPTISPMDALTPTSDLESANMNQNIVDSAPQPSIPVNNNNILEPQIEMEPSAAVMPQPAPETLDVNSSVNMNMNPFNVPQPESVVPNDSINNNLINSASNNPIPAEEVLSTQSISTPQDVNIGPVNLNMAPSPAPVSPVTNNYLSRADEIINQMKMRTETYKNDVNELSNSYLKDMEEMRAEISRNLEEAKGINELSRQTFDRAQAMTSSMNNNQAYAMPNMTTDMNQSLNLTKAA